MAFLKSIFLSLVLVATPKVFSQTVTNDLPDEIQIPIIKNRKVLTDGIFSTGEWVEAKTYMLKNGYSLLFMADQDYLYTALKFPEPMGECVMELRITPDGKEVYLLHVSGDLGEGVSSFPAAQKFDLGSHEGWEANPTKTNYKRKQEWIENGQPLERYDDIYHKREGIEFKINRKKLSGEVLYLTMSWVRVEIEEGKVKKHTFSYPSEANLENSDRWTRLNIK